MIEHFVRSMTKSDRKDGETLTQVNTHEHIIKLIEEIKNYERAFPEYDVIDSEVDLELISDVELDENNLIEQEDFLDGKKIKRSRRRLRAIRIRQRKSRHNDSVRDVVILEKKITPTTFNVGFDNEGNLVNLDIRKPKIKPKSGSRFKKLGGLKRLRRGKKSENAEPVSSEKSSKASKLKGKLGKIGKLKNAIPHRGKNKEKGE